LVYASFWAAVAVAASGKDAPKPTPVEKFLAAHPKAMKVARARKAPTDRN
jgi:hypothetical protein